MKAKSYGVIPVFRNDNDTYVLLVKNSKGSHWGLPKGTPDEDEEPLDTAKRELLEETGIKDIEVKEKPTFEEKYRFSLDGKTYDKTNIFYLGFAGSMSLSEGLDGIDEVRWVKIDEAKNTLTHQSAIDIIKQLKEFLDKNL
jgi:bis(5'-nucleosidyl)-tetraphosphatase